MKTTIPIALFLCICLYVACSKTDGCGPAQMPIRAFTLTNSMMDMALSVTVQTGATRVRVVVYGQDSAVMYGIDPKGELIKKPRYAVPIEELGPCPPNCDVEVE